MYKTAKKIVRKESEQMYALMEKLYPICRSITGNGVRKSLQILKEIVPLEVHEVPTGTVVFDWTVPKEWNINDAWLKGPKGNRIVDFRNSNLHVLNYSTPIDQEITFGELKEHIFTLPEQPQLIPYRTSYYDENWGFCMRHSKFKKLEAGTYHAYIDSSLEEGSLTYGELYIEGEEKEEVLISCHICHPSLCNDNLSGISAAIHLAQALLAKKNRYSYRFLFIPGTIGSITWLARNEQKLENIRHGLVLSCVGDAGNITYKKSRRGDAKIDHIVQKVLEDKNETYELRDFSPYGYDERQYCSPGINLPVGCFMRTPFGEFPEYHTSADNLDLADMDALEDTLSTLKQVVHVIENNQTYRNLNPKGEPNLGKRGLYKRVGGASDTEVDQMAILWTLNLCDGKHSLLDIAVRAEMPFDKIKRAAAVLYETGLLKEMN